MNIKTKNTLFLVLVLVFLQLCGFSYVSMGHGYYLDVTLMLVIIASLIANFRAALVINLAWVVLSAFFSPSVLLSLPVGLLTFVLRRYHILAIISSYCVLDSYFLITGWPLNIVAAKLFLECVTTLVFLTFLKKQLYNVKQKNEYVMTRPVFIFESFGNKEEITGVCTRPKSN